MGDLQDPMSPPFSLPDLYDLLEFANFIAYAANLVILDKPAFLSLGGGSLKDTEVLLSLTEDSLSS